MRYLKWIGIGAAILLLASGFLPWITIESKNLIITGTETSGTSFGKPAYFHYLMVILFLTCSVVQRIWAKRLNLLITALNLAWAIRNFFIIAGCSGGECPQREAGLWLVLISSILMLFSAFFPDMKVPARKIS